MNNYLTYYLFWMLIPVAISVATAHPAALGVIIVAFLLRRKLPDPVGWLTTVGKIRALRAQLENNPTNLVANRELALLLLKRGRARAALEPLERALARNPDSADLHYLIGKALLAAGEEEKAAAALDAALSRDPKLHYGEPLALRGMAKEKMGRRADAAADYQHMAKVNTSSVEAWVRLAQLRGAEGNSPAKHEALKAALKIYAQLPGFQRKNQFQWMLKARLGSLL